MREQLANYGRNPTPAQKHQWARDVLYLKKTIQAMKTEYKRITGHNVKDDDCPENEAEPEQ